MLCVFPVVLVRLVEWMLEGLSKEKAMGWLGLNELTDVLCFPSQAGHASLVAA